MYAGPASYKSLNFNGVAHLAPSIQTVSALMSALGSVDMHF